MTFVYSRTFIDEVGGEIFFWRFEGYLELGPCGAEASGCSHARLRSVKKEASRNSCSMWYFP